MKSAGDEILLKVPDAARKCSCKPGELLKAIKDHNLTEVQGVHHFLPGDDGYRIQLSVFLNWRRNPVSVLADSNVSLEVAKALLSVLIPARAALNEIIGHLETVYESAAGRREAYEQLLNGHAADDQ